MRGHVLAALRVLKVATADRIRRMTAPGQKDDKAFRNAGASACTTSSGTFCAAAWVMEACNA
ncbi:hypothetical protein ACFU9Y_41650 [Streptomyces sp. NPDC057621]|uniref:hypothetical protein n=1 Tax=Streptomyces sp. NPDC057621 TaxID=3346186 RepID=UPI0036D15FEC